jgi:hypothetical protein
MGHAISEDNLMPECVMRAVTVWTPYVNKQHCGVQVRGQDSTPYAGACFTLAVEAHCR